MAAPDVYLDACCFIYLVEGTPDWRAAVERRLHTLDSTARLVTSQLSRLECRRSRRCPRTATGAASSINATGASARGSTRTPRVLAAS